MGITGEERSVSSNIVNTSPGGLEDLLARVERDLTDDLVPVEIFNASSASRFRADSVNLDTSS